MASTELNMKTLLDSELYKRALGFISLLLVICGFLMTLWIAGIQADIKSNDAQLIIQRGVSEVRQNDFIKLRSDFENYKEYNDRNVDDIKDDIIKINEKLDIIIGKLNRE